MTEHTTGYAVFLFEPAIEALGAAAKPYLQEGPTGTHILCRGVDTGGAFVEMTLHARTKAENGDDNEIELMVPIGMVRMIVSTHSDAAFGFRSTDRDREPRPNALPVVGPDASPPNAPSESMPHGVAGVEPNATSSDDRRRPPEG